MEVIHLKKKKMNGASDYDNVVDESRVKQERKPKRKPMKIFVDDDVPLDVPLVPDVAAVAGSVLRKKKKKKKSLSSSSKETQNKNHKPWHDHLCSSSACEWIAATSL